MRLLPATAPINRPVLTVMSRTGIHGTRTSDRGTVGYEYGIRLEGTEAPKVLTAVATFVVKTTGQTSQYLLSLFGRDIVYACRWSS